MHYKVFIHYGRGSDILSAQFRDLADAKLFIERKLANDTSQPSKMIYRLYDMDELIKEYDPVKEPAQSGQAKTQQGSQGKGSGASFRPTPFNTTPRPAGSPQKWIIDPDEEEKK